MLERKFRMKFMAHDNPKGQTRVTEVQYTFTDPEFNPIFDRMRDGVELNNDPLFQAWLEPRVMFIAGHIVLDRLFAVEEVKSVD